MRKLKAIFFDMDGTIANTEELHRVAFNNVFTALKVPCQWDEKEYAQQLAISGGYERILHFLNKIYPRRSDNSECAHEIHKEKSIYYRRLLQQNRLKPRAGIVRLIKQAKKNKIKLAIVTSSSQQNFETLMQQPNFAAIAGAFDYIITSENVVAKKPAADCYEAALELSGLKAEHCLAIEDTQNGNLSAQAAKIATIITIHPFTQDHTFKNASLVVDQLGESGKPMSIINCVVKTTKKAVDLDLIERLLHHKQKDAGL